MREDGNPDNMHVVRDCIDINRSSSRELKMEK